MGYNPPESAYEGNKGPLPQRHANQTNTQDYNKSSEQGQQKDSDNGKR